jgi:hypothetical protein
MPDGEHRRKTQKHVPAKTMGALITANNGGKSPSFRIGRTMANLRMRRP